MRTCMAYDHVIGEDFTPFSSPYRGSLPYNLTRHTWIYLVPYLDISFANRFSIKCKLILQYTLSQTTVEQLKEPIFNIWHWEPNEV